MPSTVTAAETTQTTEKETSSKEREDVKSFTFRALDPILHLTWKTCAAMSGRSMEEFGIAAIKEYIKQALTKGKEKEKEV
jgi:hypothetical protein